MLFRHEALDTTESGVPAIVPGDAAASELMYRITHHDPEQRMPLETEPLSEVEVGAVPTVDRSGRALGNPLGLHRARYRHCCARGG